MPWFRRRRRQVGPAERWAGSGLRRSDRLVLDQLERHGADLAEPRHVLHFLFFEDEASSRSAATEARSHGWIVAVDPPSDGITWLVRCEREDVVLTAEHVRDTTDRFVALATRHGGEYDGWEAAV